MKPHSGTINKDWMEALQTLNAHSSLDWKNLNLKTLYADLNKQPAVQMTTDWKKIQLKEKQTAKYFTNWEREITYRTCQNAYKCHHWMQQNLGSKIGIDRRCNFCKAGNDTIQHLITDCTIIKQIWEKTHKKLEEITKTKTTFFTNNEILFNEYQQGNNTITRLKIINITKNML